MAMHFRHVVAACLLLPGAASAQSGPEYIAPDQPVYRINDNPFRLYLIRDGDTVAAPVRNLAIERDRWSRIDDSFLIERLATDIGLGNRIQTDTMTVTRRGAVTTVNGGQDYSEGEWDALLRLPDAELVPGLRWADTLSHPTSGPGGEGLFHVERSYEATGPIDTVGVSGIGVTVSGRMVFKLSMWTDSVKGQYRWFELEGPFRERHVFDAEEGQLVLRNWSMHLVGIGGDHDGATTDTVTAGLRSANLERRIPPEVADQLTRPLPGRDTTATFLNGQSPIFLHTSGLTANGLVEGMRRADGLTGHAEVIIQDGVPRTWSISWVGPESDPRSFVAEQVAPDGLRVNDRNILVPTDHWGVADFGMSAMLAPSLQHIPVDTQDVPFAVYRPTPDEWSEYVSSNRQFENFRLFVLIEDSGSQAVLILSNDGTLIYEEVTQSGSQSVRVPVTPGPRMDEVQAAISVLSPGN